MQFRIFFQYAIDKFIYKKISIIFFDKKATYPAEMKISYKFRKIFDLNQSKHLQYPNLTNYICDVGQRRLETSPQGSESGQDQLNIFNISIMESINRIEILGNVGNIRIQEAGETRAIHLSVVTNRVARNKAGENYVEATWHHVEAWEGQSNIADFSKITKGCWVRVVGRIKNNKYTNSENVEKYTVDVVANRLEVVEEKD